MAKSMLRGVFLVAGMALALQWGPVFALWWDRYGDFPPLHWFLMGLTTFLAPVAITAIFWEITDYDRSPDSETEPEDRNDG